MNKAYHILSEKNAFGTTLLFITVELAFLAPKASVNADEQLHYPHTKKIMAGGLYICHMQNLIYVIFPVASSIKKENELNNV